jgi:hypothetical protein
MLHHNQDAAGFLTKPIEKSNQWRIIRLSTNWKFRLRLRLVREYRNIRFLVTIVTAPYVHCCRQMRGHWPPLTYQLIAAVNFSGVMGARRETHSFLMVQRISFQSSQFKVIQSNLIPQRKEPLMNNRQGDCVTFQIHRVIQGSKRSFWHVHPW